MKGEPMESQLTPQQALRILDEAAAMAPLPRQQHIMVQLALTTLEQALAKPKPEPERGG